MGRRGRVVGTPREPGQVLGASWPESSAACLPQRNPHFFSDPDAWEALDRLVIRPLVEPSRVPHEASRGESRAAIRVWVPGCGSGEEAYSIAILLRARLRAAERTCNLQIFASDIDRDALPSPGPASIPPTPQPKCRRNGCGSSLCRGELTYRVVREIRDAVVFSEQDPLCDPPFVDLDLISCRHRLSGLDAETQPRLLATFHFALRQDGHLFLGADEDILPAPGAFALASPPWPVYRRLGPARRRPGRLPARGPHRREPPLVASPAGWSADRRARNLASLAQQLILQRYVPLCVLINRQAEILYLHGSAERYLQADGGAAGANLITSARPGLRPRLQAALDLAFHECRRIECRGESPPCGVPERDVHLAVEPVGQALAAEPLWLVSLAGAEAARGPATGAAPAAAAVPSWAPECSRPAGARRSRDAIRCQLEDDLRETRAELQGTLAELQAATEQRHAASEQFQSANEETRSINEELQAANEDLEIAQEELCCVNEELRAVPIGRLFVSDALQDRGHAVRTAATGREAIELVRDQPFDVVLMDVQMPEMDGYQATAAIRALPDPARAKLPIVALTAHARPEDERECLAAGMSAYLAKPLTTAALIELAERLAGNATTDN